MGKGSQKNQQKSNPDRQEAAAAELESVQSNLLLLESKRMKSAAEKKLIKKLKARVKHLQLKASEKSEQHSQREKGKGKRR